MELNQYSYDIVYRPCVENAVPVRWSSLCSGCRWKTLRDTQFPVLSGVTSMVHFIRSKNLPYFVEDVRKITTSFQLCAWVKLRYNKPRKVQLIKATQLFERLSIDIKGPLPSSSRNWYLLTVIDKYSRFPLTFPCSKLTAKTVVNCLSQLFSIFRLPNYVHSDRVFVHTISCRKSPYFQVRLMCALCIMT